MKILVTGSKGQVGTNLVLEAKKRGHQVFGFASAELDITQRRQVDKVIKAISPDVVINAAAYTAVDKAEKDRDSAYSINCNGPLNIAITCQKQGVALVHFSTDYVFGGDKGSAYTEEDEVNPAGVYGCSKLAGERAVLNNCSQFLILRTSWVFSEYGNNFVKTMLRLGAKHESLGIVDDQYGRPTSASEIAKITLDILPESDGNWGIYHLAQPSKVSWHQFAESIFKEAKKQKYHLSLKNLKRIPTSEYRTPAIRPINSELNCNKLENTFNMGIKPWSESLTKILRALGEN